MKKKKLQQERKASKKRGKLLTTLLVLSSIALFLTPFIEFHTVVYENNAIWLTIRWIIQVLILIGIWQWKKIAVYGYFLFAGILFLITFFTIYLHNPHWLTGIGMCIFLVFSLLWFFAIKRTWHLFN